MRVIALNPLLVSMDKSSICLLSWNVKGAVSAQGYRCTKGIICQHRPSVICVYETHCLFEKVKAFWSRLGYEANFIQEMMGHQGEIWVLSLINCDFDITLVDSFHQAITF